MSVSYKNLWKLLIDKLRALGEEERRLESEIVGDGTASAKESAKEGA